MVSRRTHRPTKGRGNLLTPPPSLRAKSLKTSGTSASVQNTTPEQGTHAENMSVDSNLDLEDAAMQSMTIRRSAKDNDEARLQVVAMHSRVPAWKLSKCIKVLNAQPLDLEYIAEVTEIQFASEELVAVAAKCLAGLLEAYADEAAARQATIDNAVSQCTQGLAKSKTKDAESETVVQGHPEETTEPASLGNGEDKPPHDTSKKNKEGAAQSNATAGERATAQETTQQPSSDAANSGERAMAQDTIVVIQ